MAVKIQTLLNSDRTNMMTWLEPNNRVRVGSRISLVGDEDTIWIVLWQSQPAFAGEQRKWGLNLPKSQRTER